MLDRDLAALYETETKALNLAVKRNSKRFPKDFMFQLRREEFESLRLQIETLETGRGQHSKYLPYAFTEQGVAMLSGILNSDKAINMPARLKPFGREYCNNESFCRGKKDFITTK